MTEASRELANKIIHDVRVILLDMPEHEVEKVEVDRSYMTIDSHTVKVKFKNGDTLRLDLTTHKKPAVIKSEPLAEVAL